MRTMTSNKIFLSMAALLVVGAIMTGCSNDEIIDNQQQSANNDNVVTLTATVSLDGGAGTRAYTPSTGANPGMKTFESTNKIAVLYKNTSNQTVRAQSGTLTLSDDGTKATFTVTLTNPASGGAVRYIYPYSMSKDVAANATITDDDATIDYTGIFSSQTGDLTTLGTNYDLAVFDGSLSGTELPSSAILKNPLAICEFTLTDRDNGNAAITNAMTRLTINDGTNIYRVAPSGLSTIYVAMKPVSSHTIALTGDTGSKIYFKTATGKTLETSKFYPITVSMIPLAIGNVICPDGSIYETRDAAVTAGETPVAVICFLGDGDDSDDTYNHCLALALKNATTSYVKWCGQYTATCLPKQYSGSGDPAEAPTIDMAGIANTDILVGNSPHNHCGFPNPSDYNAAKAARYYKYADGVDAGAHPLGTSEWFLPSAGQWAEMCDYASLYLKDAGMQTTGYWTSTECDAAHAWRFLFNKDSMSGSFTGDGGSDPGNNKEAFPNPVRACLAF